MLLAGIFMMTCVMRKIYSAVNLVSSNSSTKRKMRRLWEMERTSFMFVFCFSFFWVFSLAFRFHEQRRRSLYEDSITAYTTCILDNFARGIPNPSTSPRADTSMLRPFGVQSGNGCGSVFPKRPNNFLVDMLQIATFSQGILNFFDSRPSILKKWRHEGKQFAARRSSMFSVRKSVRKSMKKSGSTFNTGSKSAASSSRSIDSRASRASSNSSAGGAAVELPSRGTRSTQEGVFRKSLRVSRKLFKNLMESRAERARSSMSSYSERSIEGRNSSADSQTLGDLVDEAVEDVVRAKGLGFYQQTGIKKMRSREGSTVGMKKPQDVKNEEYVATIAKVQLPHPPDRKAQRASVQIDFEATRRSEKMIGKV